MSDSLQPNGSHPVSPGIPTQGSNPGLPALQVNSLPLRHPGWYYQSHKTGKAPWVSTKCQVLKISTSFWCGLVYKRAWAFHAPPLSVPPPIATARRTVSLTGSSQPTSCSTVFPGAQRYVYITFGSPTKSPGSCRLPATTLAPRGFSWPPPTGAQVQPTPSLSCICQWKWETLTV